MRENHACVLAIAFAFSTSAHAAEMCKGTESYDTKIDLTNPACVRTLSDARGDYDRAYARVLKQATDSTGKNVNYLREISNDFGAENYSKVHVYLNDAHSINKRTDLTTAEKKASKNALRGQLLNDISKISSKLNGRYKDISCPLFDPSTESETGCNLHTGILGQPNPATPSFARRLYINGSESDTVGFTICTFKRLDEDDDIGPDLRFHDRRAWLEGNYRESRSALHYLPFNVCSSVNISGDYPVFTHADPKDALKHPLNSHNINTFRQQEMNSNEPFYNKTVEEYARARMPEFCMKPCTPPAVTTADSSSQPPKAPGSSSDLPIVIDEEGKTKAE